MFYLCTVYFLYSKPCILILDFSATSFSGGGGDTTGGGGETTGGGGDTTGGGGDTTGGGGDTTGGGGDTTGGGGDTTGGGGDTTGGGGDTTVVYVEYAGCGVRQLMPYSSAWTRAWT